MGKMKLYLKAPIVAKSMEKWKDEAGLEEEKRKREVRSLQRTIQRHKKKKERNAVYDFVTVPLAKVEVETHVHDYGATTTTDELSFRVCKTCGYRDEWEDF